MTNEVDEPIAPYRSISPLNLSGIRPWEYKIIVLPDEVDEKSRGGVLYDEKTRDQMQRGICKGTLVDMSRLAFNYDADMQTVIPVEERPTIGMRILFAKYAGAEIEGVDRRKYRIMNDKDAMGEVVLEDAPQDAEVIPLTFKGGEVA